VDHDPGLADLIDAAHVNPPPPLFGTIIAQPPAPHPTPHPHALPPLPVAKPARIGRIVLRGGKSLPPPNDVPLPSN
jgi:hypothetical protein